MEDFRNDRQQVQDGNRTIFSEPGRTLVREGDQTLIRHTETDRFRINARTMSVQQRGRNTLTTISRPDGTTILTTLDDNGRLLRRARRDRLGREIVLIDNGRGLGVGPRVFVNLPPPVLSVQPDRYIVEAEGADDSLIYDTLIAPPVDRIDRRYTLDEIRYSASLRDRMRRVDVDTITFDFGSWEVTPEQAERLAGIANAMRRAIQR